MLNRHTIVTFVLVQALTAAATAQTLGEDVAALTLDELQNIRVVTVSRTSEGAADAPGRVEVVTGRDIERRGYRSLADLLRDVPAFKIDSRVDQDLSSDITVQGTRGLSRLVVLLDGVRISSPTNEALPILANYPVHSAKQVEIVYGPASALYGADAFSGVINIISRDADEADGVRASTTIGQGGLVNTEAAFGHRLRNAIEFTVSGQVFYDAQPDLTRSYPADFGGLTSHQTGVFNTIFGPMTAAMPVTSKYHVPVKARSFHGTIRAGNLTASLFESVVRTSNTPAYTPDNAVYNDIAFQENRLVVANVAYRMKLAAADTTTSVMVSRHVLAPQSGYFNVFSNMQRSYKYAYGAMVRGEHQVAWRPARRLTVTTGGLYERLFSIPQTADLNEPIRGREPGTILGTPIVDELFEIHYANVGAYAQAQWTIHKRLSLTAGGRADYNTRYDKVFNPRVGLVSRATRSTTLKLMYGTAYLAPSPYQSFSHYGSFYSLDGGNTYQSDFWHVPNPELKPQHKQTVESEVQQGLGRHVQITVSAFRSTLSDLVLESDVTSRQSGEYLGWPVAFLQQSVNGGAETMHGGTIGMSVIATPGPGRRVSLRGSVSLATGHVREDSAPGGIVESGGMSPVLGQFGADVDWNLWSLAPRLVAVGQQRAIALDTSDAGVWRRRTLPGHATLDMTLRRRRIFGMFDAFAAVENLLDTRYRALNLRAFTNPEEMEGSPQNPRRISAGLQLRLR
jgi:outer membrane receptor protein involved in Fe transport